MNLKPLSKYLNSNQILLNDIMLELVSEFNEEVTNEIPVTKLDDASNKTDNISNNPNNFSIKAVLTGESKDRNYDKILALAKKREPVSLYVDKLYNNLGIARLTKTISTFTYIEVEIEFIQMEFAYIDFIPAPSSKAKPIVTQKTEIKTSKQDFEGELASESIKLKGE